MLPLFDSSLTKSFLIAIPTLFALTVQAVPVSEAFPIREVQLLDGPFKHSQELGLEYVLKHDPDRLLAPYLREAGLEMKAQPYGNWESSGLDGHTAGHYLSALAYFSAATHDKEAERRLDYMLDELTRCQKAHGDGYIGGVPHSDKIWSAVKQGNVEAGNFSMNGAWVPWYNIHKVFAGLRDAWLVAGKEQAGYMLIRLADWCEDLTKDLSEEQMQAMLGSEHGGMVDVLMDLYRATDEERYLALAQRFVHHAVVDPLEVQSDELTGLHANTQIPKIIGSAKLGVYAEDAEELSAAKFFWDRVVNHRSIAIGGNSVREHFHSDDDFSPMIESRQGPESCNTFNMLQLTEVLFDEHPNAEYTDYFERALYNHILSVQHPEHGGLVYFTPMRPGHYRVYSQPNVCFWCCVGSGMENPARYNRFIYAHSKDTLWVNLFIASRLDWEDMGVRLTQETEFPQSTQSRLVIETESPREFSVAIRKPGWASGICLTLNGEPLDGYVEKDGYLYVTLEWSGHDVLELEMGMSLRWEPLPASSEYGAFEYGPMVLGARCGDGELTNLIADGSRMGHVAAGAYADIESLPVLEGSVEEILQSVSAVPGKPLHFRIDGHIRGEGMEGLELEPFEGIHDSRYVLYFRKVEEGGYAAMQAEQKAAYEREKALEVRILDQIELGEQQPEVEHDLTGEAMQTGHNAGEHWRNTEDFMEYKLKVGDAKRFQLRLTHFGGDGSRACSVLVNGKTLGEFRPSWSDPDRFLEHVIEFGLADIPIGEEAGVIRVRLESLDHKRTPDIYTIQLLRAE